MKIVTKLKIIVLVPVFIALVAGLAIAYQDYSLQVDWNNRGKVRDLLTCLNDFDNLIYAYMLYHEERPKKQFLIEHEKVARLVTTIEPADAEQRRMLNVLNTQMNLLKILFGKLMVLESPRAEMDSAASEAEERLSGQLIAASSQAVEDGLALLTLVNSKSFSTHTFLSHFLFILIIGVTVVIIFFSSQLMRSISVSLAKIVKGMETIGSGNLDYRIGMTEPDEIGGLARSFDRMTDLLTKSYTDLRRSEERLRVVIATAKLGIFEYFPQTGRLFWSDTAKSYFGFSSEASIDYDHFLAGIHPEDRERVNRMIQRTFQSESNPPQEIEYRTLGPDGTERWLFARFQVFFDKNGVAVHSIGAALDITEQKKIHELQALKDVLEETVQQRTHELIETQKQYLHAEKLAAIGKLSASIAHEFNNPLQAIMTILHGLRQVVDGSDLKMLELSISECKRIKKLIRDLQMFYRPSTQKKEFVDVRSVFDSLLLLLKSDFKKKKISVELDFQKRLPHIFVVPDQIKQVFLNLLANAAEACFDSGGVITVSTRQENDRVAVAIKDTGIGIKPEEIDHIFRPFYTSKDAIKGTGLGLSVSYGIVKNHGGRILVESQPGKGATFTVLLPLNEESEVETKVW